MSNPPVAVADVPHTYSGKNQTSGTSSLHAALDKNGSIGRRSRWRWIKTLSPLHWVLLVILASIVISAIFAGWIAPYDPTTNDLRNRLTPPAFQSGGSSAHWLGTDQMGRDILSRLIYGARVSLAIAVIGTIVGATLGALCGLISGFKRGAIDDFIMLVVDAYISLPFIIIALAIIAMFGSSFIVITLLAILSGFAGYTRVSRGLALQITQEQYIVAARSIGVSPARVLCRHALPNLLAPLIVLATMEMSSIILLEASLSFLGFGIQPPTPAWGLMVSEGREYLNSSWWVGVPPGIAIMVIAICISLLGDWLRDVLDPTTES
ncbi:ABC transporter permease [soil metagenome]